MRTWLSLLPPLRRVRRRLVERARDGFGLPQHFDLKKLRKRERFRQDYRLLADALFRQLEFESVYDVGCANGFLLCEFERCGKRLGGIEKSEAARAVLPAVLIGRVTIGDFALAAGAAGSPWDLVCCVEVAEHIPRGRSLDLVSVISGLARRWIYFTAAPPDQPGHGHINCRPHEEWLEMFASHGWSLDAERTDGLRCHLAGLERASWLRGNSLILKPAA